MGKISGLNQYTTPTTNDYVPIVRASSPATFRVTLSNLISLIASSFSNKSISQLAIYNPCAFLAIENKTSPSVPTVGAGTAIIFNTESYDVSNNYDATTGIFTAPYNGYYHFDTQISVKDMATQTLFIEFDVNGVEKQRFGRRDGASGYGSVGGGIDIKLTAGDAVIVRAQLIGTARYLETGFSYFSGHLIALS